MRTRAAGIVIAIAVGLCVRVADAQDARDACFSASEQAQLLRNKGSLREARRPLLVCAGAACPSQMRGDCAKWLSEVEATMATVDIEVHDADGAELTEVHVALDGEKLLDRVDGKPTEVDPGEHTFVFTNADNRVVEKRLVIHPGDRARRLSIVFEAPRQVVRTQPISPPERRPFPYLAVGFSAFAVAAGGVGATLAITGLVQENQLSGTCAPRCSDDSVSALRRQYVAADVLFSVALLSAGVAAWQWVVATSGHRPRTSRLVGLRVEF